MKSITHFLPLLVFLALGVSPSKAQLILNVSDPKVTGNKAVVRVECRNELTEPVRSARAVCFLMDEQGKLAGREGRVAHWRRQDPADAGGGADQLIPPRVPVDGDRTAKPSATLTVTRIVMEDGTLAAPKKDVVLVPPSQAERTPGKE